MDSAKDSEAGRPQLVPDRPDNGRDVSTATNDLPRTDGPLPVPGSPVPHPPVWLQRFAMIVQVVLFIWAGSILIVLPWKLTDLWLNTAFVAMRPELRSFLGNYFVRGMVTGIGFVDVWLGIWIAVHYHDRK